MRTSAAVRFLVNILFMLFWFHFVACAYRFYFCGYKYRVKLRRRKQLTNLAGHSVVLLSHSNVSDDRRFDLLLEQFSAFKFLLNNFNGIYFFFHSILWLPFKTTCSLTCHNNRFAIRYSFKPHNVSFLFSIEICYLVTSHFLTMFYLWIGEKIMHRRINTHTRRNRNTLTHSHLRNAMRGYFNFVVAG